MRNEPDRVPPATISLPSRLAGRTPAPSHLRHSSAKVRATGEIILPPRIARAGADEERVPDTTKSEAPSSAPRPKLVRAALYMWVQGFGFTPGTNALAVRPASLLVLEVPTCGRRTGHAGHCASGWARKPAVENGDGVIGPRSVQAPGMMKKESGCDVRRTCCEDPAVALPFGHRSADCRRRSRTTT